MSTKQMSIGDVLAFIAACKDNSELNQISQSVRDRMKRVGKTSISVGDVVWVDWSGTLYPVIVEKRNPTRFIGAYYDASGYRKGYTIPYAMAMHPLEIHAGDAKCHDLMTAHCDANDIEYPEDYDVFFAKLKYIQQTGGI